MSTIPINDTHRLPYIKGRFTAIRLGAGQTTPLKFFDSDENDIGYTIYTNSEGYVCDANGNLLGNGIFLHEDAVVSGHYNGGRFVQWAVKGTLGDVTVNDGKLLNRHGNVVWSANARFDYILNWDDIANTPQLNQWSEDQQSAVITSAPWDSLSVGQFTKVLTLDYSENYMPASERIQNVILVPQPSQATRYGQLVFVKVVRQKASAINFWNYGDSTTKVCTIRGTGTALLALVNGNRFICLEQSGTPDYQDFEDVTINPLIGGALDNGHRFIADTTAKVMRIGGNASNVGYAMCELNLAKGDLTKSKRVIMWWTPTGSNVNYSCLVRVWDGTSWKPAVWLRPYMPVEVIFFPTNSNALDVVTVGVDYPTLPSIVPVTCTVASHTVDANNKVTCISANVTLPTGATRVLVEWDIPSIPTGGDSYHLVSKFVVPPNWHGDIFVKGSNNGVDSITDGRVTLYVKFKTPDGTYLRRDSIQGMDKYDFTDNSDGGHCDGCAKVFIESDSTGGIYQAIG